MLKLEINKWFSWQMVSGYQSKPYYSPIKILDIQIGNELELVELQFYNACYSLINKEVSHSLKIVEHSKDCIICEIGPFENSETKKMATIEMIDYDWLKKYIFTNVIDTSNCIADYLDNYYNLKNS